MMTYIVPPDMKEREKIVGGVLTIAQFAWLLGGFIIGGLIFILLYTPAGGVIAMLVGLPIAAALGLPFAFYKKNELTLFQYLWLKHIFNSKAKRLPNTR